VSRASLLRSSTMRVSTLFFSVLDESGLILVGHGRQSAPPLAQARLPLGLPLSGKSSLLNSHPVGAPPPRSVRISLAILHLSPKKVR
jgi:hypothetical protein